MSGYIITNGTIYIKRTSNFGAFHGEVYTTENPDDAKVWTRKADAEYKLAILHVRANSSYAHRLDSKGRRYAEAELSIVENATVIARSSAVEVE